MIGRRGFLTSLVGLAGATAAGAIAAISKSPDLEPAKLEPRSPEPAPHPTIDSDSWVEMSVKWRARDHQLYACYSGFKRHGQQVSHFLWQEAPPYIVRTGGIIESFHLRVNGLTSFLDVQPHRIEVRDGAVIHFSLDEISGEARFSTQSQLDANYAERHSLWIPLQDPHRYRRHADYQIAAPVLERRCTYRFPDHPIVPAKPVVWQDDLGRPVYPERHVCVPS